MRITSIELAGSIDEGKRLPRAFARITRKPDSDFIEVTIHLPTGDRTHHVQPDDNDDIWGMATCLQEMLDGCKGTNSMVNDYYRELQCFAD